MKPYSYPREESFKQKKQKQNKTKNHKAFEEDQHKSTLCPQENKHGGRYLKKKTISLEEGVIKVESR